MAHAGQELDAGRGFALRLLATAAETDDGSLVMEATYAGGGPLPPMHAHPNQAERFEVLEGSMRAVIDGVERRFGAGESFEVAPATPHRMAAEVPTRMRWTVTPALRTAEMFERLFGVTEPPPGLDFLDEFSAEYRLVAEG